MLMVEAGRFELPSCIRSARFINEQGYLYYINSPIAIQTKSATIINKVIIPSAKSIVHPFFCRNLVFS